MYSKVGDEHKESYGGIQDVMLQAKYLKVKIVDSDRKRMYNILTEEHAYSARSVKE